MKTASTLLHPSLGAAVGVPLAQVRLNDEQRIAVLFQGAALLAHLEHAQRYLVSGWDTARVDDGALLRLGPAGPGRSSELPQAQLLDLLTRLFPASGDQAQISGKGRPRNVARWLQERWRQFLVPLSPDQAVAEILERAPFLWEAAFTPARLALVAEWRGPDRSTLWFAGPGPQRTRFLAQGKRRREVEDLLASDAARDLWDGWQAGDDPVDLARKGQVRRAISSWQRRPPRRRDEVLLYARCLFDRGRFSQANELLKNRTRFEAQLIRLRCLSELGEHAAARQLIARLVKKTLAAPDLFELAETAVRILAMQGLHDQSLDLVQRAARAAGKHTLYRLRAKLLAVEAAWDRNDTEIMKRRLLEADAAQHQPKLKRRWHEVHSLVAIGQRDGATAMQHSSAVLRNFRRQMSLTEAGRRWSDISYARLLLDDAAGAERAARKAQLLLSQTESSGQKTLAPFNLAEIRLRRGKVGKVYEALRLATAENRRIRNYRGLVADLELWVRLDLVQGRPESALIRCQEAIALIEEHEVGDRGIFDLFSARAHGWLGHADESSNELAKVPPKMFFELDTEERPAVWALAGELDEAARAALDTPWAELWSCLAAGMHPRPAVWDELERLERYRAARLVYDYLMVAPETVPPVWIQRSKECFRSIEAHGFAKRLESRFSSPWRSVSRFLSRQGAEESRIPELFDSAGYPEVRLTLQTDDGELDLKSGPGGDSVLHGAHAAGRLVLRSAIIDPTLEALFQLVRRDIRVPIKQRGRGNGNLRQSGMIGESAAFLQALERLDQLAKGELPILVLGETGVGKELAARRVHTMSRRSDGPFEAVNCAALPEENMVQSELFGHVRGSFTGADRDRQGIFERAFGGTVFLDEIGDLPPVVQGKLLRVLQEGELRRLGEDYVRRVDVRVVAATHRNLRRMVEEGSFRRDLYFRLKGAQVALPPLRERGNDVLLLAQHLLRESWANLGWNEEPPPRFSSGAGALIASYSWPGNVRELRQAMASAATLAQGREIRVDDLGLDDVKPQNPASFHDQVDEFARRLIDQTLSECGGNLAEGARRLQTTRQTLSHWTRKLGIDPSDYRSS